MGPKKIEVEWGDDTIRMRALEKALHRYMRKVFQQARRILTSEKINATGELYKSLDYEVQVDELKITLQPMGTDYWDYVNQGVKGSTSDAKAPESPYQFGTGTGPQGQLEPSIRQWIDDKPVNQWRDKKGRFMSKDAMAFIISRSVYTTGLKPTNFMTNPFERLFERNLFLFRLALLFDLEEVMTPDPDEFEISI